MQRIKEKIYHSSSFTNFPIDKINQIGIQLQGLIGSLRSFFVAYVNEKLAKPIVFITPDTDSGEQLYEDLQQILPGQAISFIPTTENKPYDENPTNPILLKLKSEGLQNFIAIDNNITILTAKSLILKTISPENFIDRQIILEKSKDVKFENLIQLLTVAGFERVEIVEDVGQISVRGGIIDVYSWSYEDPVRLEFFGDTIESIRFFNVMTQRSLNETEQVTILPNLDNNQSSIIDYIPEKSIFFIEEKTAIFDQISDYLKNANEIYQSLVQQNIIPEKVQQKYLKTRDIEDFINQKKTLHLDLLVNEKLFSYQFNCSLPPTFASNLSRLISFIKKYKANSADIWIQCDTAIQAERLIEILEEENIDMHANVTIGAVHQGFILNEINLYLLTDHEIFDRFKKRKTYRRFKNGEYLRSLKSLSLDDYVVHIDYGIGKYRGLAVIESSGSKRECIKLEFADGDSLFVSIDRLNRVQKYQTDADIEPKITKLGTGEWEKLKNKTQESVQKIAIELLQLYAERKAQKGFAFSSDTHWQKELEASFPFEETEDQNRSISEVKQDLEKSEPMDRLLCGDVGYGKTEVALRAAFKVVNDGKQVVLLVPTTILAYQHYQTFIERIANYPINIEMLSRFKTRKKQKEIIEKIQNGVVDVVIGTHRILSDDVKFKDLGLLIIDEEQRFGVRHKEKLKMFRATVDVLTMTATPIPRTMHLSLMGARDLSHIETPPRNRLPVVTEIHEWDEEFISHVITRELNRKGQVYFVHNRVRTIDGIKSMIQELLPNAKIAVAHGQLPEFQLEKIMLDFIHKKYEILISTMIIENGLDIPNVNTIIIDHADKFGLAQLYQLRGRVGRSDKQAYAYLLLRERTRLNDLAKRRLRAIQDFTDLGSGFKLALRDMEIRGVGNILGKEQSGYIQSVGFDLYCKILEEAVSDLKNEMDVGETIIKQRRFTDPKVDTDFDLIIPKDYIYDEKERITVYHRLVNLKSLDEIEKLKDELADRFGQLPYDVVCLINTIKLKVLAGKIYASHIIFKKNYLKIYFAQEAQNDDLFYTEIIPSLMNQKIAKVQFLNKPDSLGVNITLVGAKRIEQLDFANNVLKYIA